MKPLPECPEVTEARQAFDLAKAPASLAPARKALAEAIERADQRFQEEVARLGQEHGVTVR